MSENKEIVPAATTALLALANGGGGQFAYAEAAAMIKAEATSAGLTVSDGKVEELFYAALRRLRRERGIHIRGKAGVYRVCTTDEALRRVLETNRLAVVHKARIAVDEVVGIQHAPGIDEETRVRVNHEERRLSSGLMHVESAYLKRQRTKEAKPPPGIEED